MGLLTLSGVLNVPLRPLHDGLRAGIDFAQGHARGASPRLGGHVAGPTVRVGSTIPVSWSVPGANGEPMEAVDPVTHALYATWMSGGSSPGIWFTRSTDGGASFAPAQIVLGSQNFTNNTTSAFSWDPSIVTSSNGTVYVAFIHANSSDNNSGAPFVAVSYNHGRSFAFVTQVFRPNPLGADDRDFIAVAPNGTLYMTWDYAPNVGQVQFNCVGAYSCSFAAGDLNIVFARSVDGGHHWSRSVHVSPGFPHGGAWSAPVVVERDGHLAVLYAAFRTAPVTLALSDGHEFFTTSSDGGATWSSPVLVGRPAFTTTNSTWWIDGSLAVGAGGTLFATFDTQAPHGDIAWVVDSTDHGATWSKPLRVASGASPSAHLVQVVAGPRGTAYVAWLTNDTARGWSIHAAVFSPFGAAPRLGPAVRVSSYYGIDGVWPGDTIGLVYLGDEHLSVAWGAGLISGGLATDNVFNVVVSFERRAG
ncbi:MAG: glycoside hydrolase [Thermoplasmata archaeon]|nr:glycoside hydrolase [Thermoplasmata archaeon]